MLIFQHGEGVITREFHPILENCALFEGIHTENLSALLGCIGGRAISERPAALTNFPIIDHALGNLAENFWDLTWNDEKPYLPYETRLLRSLTNAVGAGRMRQATRELEKAYAHGIDSAARMMSLNCLRGIRVLGTSAPKSAPPLCLLPIRPSSWARDKERVRMKSMPFWWRNMEKRTRAMRNILAERPSSI